MNYKIGFYNSGIENVHSLNDICDCVFSDWEKLKKHLRVNDVIVVNDLIHLYGIPTIELLSLKREFGLTICIDKELDNEPPQAFQDFSFNTTIALLEYIKLNKELIKKALVLT